MNARTLTVLVACLASLAPARTLHVPDTFRSIAAAIHESEEGDTILLAAGIYKETVDLPDRVSLIGEHRDEVIIVGRENRPVVRGGDRSLVKHVTIKSGSVGIRSENKLMIIEGNVITENRETGVHALVSLPMIRNNVIVRNDWTGIFCESASALKTRIEHNVIAENRYSGISLSGKTQVVIQNNIIVNNGKFGIWVARDSRRSRIESNNFFSNRKRQSQYAIIGASNIQQDPGYPAIRADVYDYLRPPAYDFDGAGKGGAVIGLISEQELEREKFDKDRDGVLDEVDQCTGVAEDMDGFEDEDGCPEFDNDGDGIYDSQDRCDNEAEDVDGFEDVDGCPDTDNDADSAPDSDDSCPDEPETVNGFKDDDGCPDEKPAE